MALPLSGPLSLANIQAEFGGANPASLSEYYKGGAYISILNPTTPNVPTSGVINISDFYGAAQYIPTFQTVTFTTSGTFTVPSTFSGNITFTLRSAPGGSGGADTQPGYPGYPGHQVVGNVAAAPNDAVVISIGGAGLNGSGGGGAAGGAGGSGGSLGYGGGRRWCFWHLRIEWIGRRSRRSHSGHIKRNPRSRSRRRRWWRWWRKRQWRPTSTGLCIQRRNSGRSW
jgi:hypothetical protein